jgi:hypothetical protein
MEAAAMDRERDRARARVVELVDAARVWPRWRRRMGGAAPPRVVRRAAGLGVRPVARALGVDARTMRGWERGDHRPREAATAAAWLDLLDQLEQAVAEAEREHGGAGELPATGTEGGRGAREP